MPRAPRGSGSTRRPSAESRTPREISRPPATAQTAVRSTAARTPRETGGSHPVAPRASPAEARAAPAASPGAEKAAAPQETVFTEAPTVTAQAPRPESGASPASPRFRIFIVDPGWDSPAHRVLQANFGLIRELQKNDPIYVLGRDKSIEFLRDHPERFGHEPLIAVHDMAACREDGTPDPDFHGFRLHLGFMHTDKQALMALQNFVRFLTTHRQSVALEEDIRRDLRREGLAGAIEIILQHEAREIGE
jgi:hypothetical protein